ncbi:MAG TPA: flagellar motor switch protein FliM [Bryobacterales bacterium]|nr:flagellar motor switch protein FliM [Bryobacterales bacterium]
MAIDTQLSQEEIDRLFREASSVGVEEARQAAKKSFIYDFRRPDRIPKEQLRSIHLLHDFFARNLASSLGAYLRAYVVVHLVSVEQLSFAEFLQYLPTPTCIATVGMKPLDGNAVLEINPSLVFPILDILLGGNGKASMKEFRELTEIEQSIIEGVLRIVLHDLSETWRPVAEINFSIEEMETQPQLIQILSPNEAIVAVGFEITTGENRGMMNFGIPSIMVKMLGQQFEQQWSIRRKTGNDAEQQMMQRLVSALPVTLDARLEGATIRTDDLLHLEQGDVVTFDIPLSRPVHMNVNGQRKFEGEVVMAGKNRAVLIHSVPEY